MGWASKHIEQLKQGKTVSFRPHGRSMAGKIDSGQLVTVVPRTVDPKVGDIVLCNWIDWESEEFEDVRTWAERRKLFGT